MELEDVNLIIGAIAVSVFVVTLAVVGVMYMDGINACEKESLETKVVVIQDKFVQDTGLSGDRYYFLDENGIDYEIYGGRNGLRYTKLRLNGTYRIRASMRLGISCEEKMVKNDRKRENE